MSRAVRINATMDEDLVRRVDAFASSRYEDRSTAVRQLLDFALRELQKREALEAYRESRLTLREFARALGLDVWAAHDLLRAEGVAVARGDRLETKSALDDALHAVSRGRGRSSGRSPG